MDQIARYQSILEDQYYNPNNIDNYKLGINKLNDEEYEIIIGRNIDIYKTRIDKTTKLNGILKEYRSILYKFLVEKINEKSKFKSFIEFVKINKKESININITLKTKYFFEKVELTLDKLTDDYFKKQIDETKLKTFVFEEYDDITDEDIEWFDKNNTGVYDKLMEEDKKKFTYLKNNLKCKNKRYPLSKNSMMHTKKNNFEIKYNKEQIYIFGDITLKLLENKKELIKYNNKLYGYYGSEEHYNYIIKLKLPINYNKVIVKNYHTVNCNNYRHSKSYSIIIDNDFLILFKQDNQYTADNLIFI